MGVDLKQKQQQQQREREDLEQWTTVFYLSLREIKEDIILIGSWIENRTERTTASSITVKYAGSRDGHVPDHTHICPFGHECWYKFTILH